MAPFLASLTARLRGSLLARNTLWMFAGQGLRTVLQGAYFILLARALGVSGYGAFIGVVSLVGILAPFASLGSGNILIKNVARRPEVFRTYWGNALALTGISGLLLLAVLMLARQAALPASISPWLVGALALTDLICTRLTDVSAQAYQAVQRLARTAQIQVLVNALRLVGVVLLLALHPRDPALTWGAIYLASTGLSAVIAVALACRELGSPRFGRGEFEMKEGFYFSVSMSASSIYNDIDKAMLLRLSTAESAGIYGAAYRLIEVSFMPVRSLLFASYASFFRHGAAGVRGSLSFALKFVPVVGAYGLAAGVALFLFAPVVPVILGGEYAKAVEAIRWLALLPLLKGMHYFAADTLTGAGHQGLRSGTQLFIAAFNVGINLWIIPAWSWRGAAWSSLASDGLLMLVLWGLVWRLARQAPVPVVAPIVSDSVGA